MAPAQLSSSFTSSHEPPRSIITTSTSSPSRANLCSRQHAIVFSVTYGGRTVSICVACALLDFLVKFLFFIPRFILVLASFGVPLLLLPVGSLIDLTSPPMLVAQAIALVWYTCYLPGLQTIQSKRESFNRKRRMLQAVEARRTRSSGSDAGDLRKSRTEMVVAKSCAAIEAEHSTCGEDEVVTRRSMTQSVGEKLLCLRKFACEKATFASQGVQNGLSSARSAVTRSCWQLMVSARVTVTTTVSTAATTVAATAAATASRAIMTTKALLFTCVRIPTVSVRLSVWMLASAWGLLVPWMRIQRQLSSDSASTSISDSALAEGTADVCTREAGERTRKRGGKGKKGARLGKGGRGSGGKAAFEAEEHSGCNNNEEREEHETIEQSKVAELESDVAAQERTEIPEVAEVPELIDGLLEEKESSEKERSRKRAFRKQRRARRERATSEARQGDSPSDAEVTSVQADVEPKQQNMTVNVRKSEEQQLAQLTQLTQLTKLSPPELSHLIDQLMLVAAGNEGAGSEGDSGESDYISKPAARQSRQTKPSSDTSEANGWESSSSSCSGSGSGSDSSSNAVSRSSSNGGSSSRSNGATSTLASSLSSPYAPPVVPSSFPTSTPSLPPLSPSSSSLSPSLSYTLPSPVSSAGKPLPSPVAPVHVQSFQHQWQQQHQQIQQHFHNQKEQQQHHHHHQQPQQQQRASGGAAAAQWEMWGASRLDTQHLLQQQQQQQQQEGNTESAGTRTTNLFWSPDDKPWLPWLPSPTALSPSLKAPGALSKWSPTPLSPPTEAPGMPFMLPQGSSSGSFANSAVESAVSGFDWLERDADVTLPPPAMPVHVAYAAASATGNSPSTRVLTQFPALSNAGFPCSASHPFHFDSSVKLGGGSVERKQQQHCAVASLLPGSPFERNGEGPKMSSHGNYSLLGSGFADSLVSGNVMYTREAIEEWME